VTGVNILSAREVPLGGPRAMLVRRTLPSRARSMIGAWCFVDHYGPNPVTPSTGMRVPPHPHTGLQTVSWLFSGEIVHRDSVGSLAAVRPGELNIMTAGRGISHSEVSTPESTVLHGVQLWLALPNEARDRAPFFESHVAVRSMVGPATLQVFAGTVNGSTATVTTFSRIVGAQLDLPAGTSVTLAVDPRDEHGVLVDAGTIHLQDSPVAATELAFVPQGESQLTIAAGAADARLIIIGGEPFTEQIVMWWNFVGRSHEDIVAFRAAWQAEAIGIGPGLGMGSLAEHAYFPSAQQHVAGLGHAYEGAPLPAPEMPTVRLKPRA
jgi:redox-sensitive bicupin YhaK (pirin superfamily)